MQLIEWPQFFEKTLSPQCDSFAEIFPAGNSSAVTVGIFDGVHLGHKALIEQVVSHNGTVPVVVTFRQSHHKKARGREHSGDILSFFQKMFVFENLGVSITIVIDFSDSFRHMSGAEFLRILSEHCGMSFMAVGSNFRCGYRLDTDAQAILEFNDKLGIKTSIVQPLTEAGVPVSSSRIRAAIAGGRLRDAEVMLGRPFAVDLSGALTGELAGASVSSAGKVSHCGITYDIAGQGRILPPPGRYKVLLFDKSHDSKSAGTPAEILVEKGNVIIGGDLAGASLERAEFLSL